MPKRRVGDLVGVVALAVLLALHAGKLYQAWSTSPLVFAEGIYSIDKTAIGRVPAHDKTNDIVRRTLERQGGLLPGYQPAVFKFAGNLHVSLALPPAGRAKEIFSAIGSALNAEAERAGEYQTRQLVDKLASLGLPQECAARLKQLLQIENIHTEVLWLSRVEMHNKRWVSPLDIMTLGGLVLAIVLWVRAPRTS